MTSSSKTSSGQHSRAEFRTQVRPEDGPAVERLVRKTGVFSDSEVAIARELVDENLSKGEEASGYHFLFADGANGLDGYACFGPVPGAHRRFELYWIAVDPDARRLRLGRRLQAATEEAARAMGGVYLVAETSTLPQYEPARQFYVSGGFKLIAEVPDWHDDGDGMAIFRKPL
jgi:ribosomal protein S18 acetylase RimI-like enzyme